MQMQMRKRKKRERGRFIEWEVKMLWMYGQRPKR